VHALAEQQAVDEHGDARPLAVHGVGQPPPFVTEAAGFAHAFECMPAPAIRPMRPEDAPAVVTSSDAAFADLDRRHGLPPTPPGDPARARARVTHILATDPGGGWVAERDGEIVGSSLALVREGVWGLSLLAVRPDAQSSGAGRELLALAVDYGRDARGGMIMASDDQRALRAYSRAGFELHPTLLATGRPRPLRAPPGVRAGDAADRAFIERVDRAVRGGAHGPDIDVLIRWGSRLLVVPERGYALTGTEGVKLLAALDDDAAGDLLRAGLADAPADRDIRIEAITARQQWAVPILLDAGLALRVGGAMMLRGELGPLAPYLPNGAYL
jgi:GNAT superfamily N-acetyltransferase